MRYAKAGVAVVAAVVSALIPAFSDGHLTTLEWINVAIAAAGAANVFTAPNVPHAPVTKFALSTLMTVLQFAATFITGGMSQPPAVWLQLVASALGSAGVFGIKNSPPAP